MSSPPTGTPTSIPPPPPSTPVSTPSETSSTTRPPSTTSESSSTSLPSSSTSDTRSNQSSSSLPTSTTFSTSSPTPPPRPTPTPSDSQSTFLSVSNGNTVVVTTVVRSTPSSTGVVKGNSKGFFDNTGAVAGTFSVVGLVGLGILIFIITTVIRRRRAEKFDEDVALAAAEAAATAHNPDFDDYGYSASSHNAGGYGYADTYHQDPVKFPPTRETYGMSEVGATTYADAENYTAGTGGGPGAAGIGAGVLYRSKSGKNQPDPYHAYAVHNDPTAPQNPANLRHRNPTQGQWEDPSLVGGGYDVARNISQSRPAGGVSRQKSVQSANPEPSLSSHYSTDPLTHDQHSQPPPIPESYLDRYRAGVDSENHETQARPLSLASTADPYGGVVPVKPLAQQTPFPQQPGNPDDLLNPFDARPESDRRLSDASHYSEGSQPNFENDEPRMSLRDDEDYGAGRRVLKVANE